jgi:AraC family transcriptional regulator of adaptative response/methylated-DNA-[protein]-cysteine methyltransferase
MSDIASMEYIRYAWGSSSLGDFLSAWGDEGLVSFEFADRNSEAVKRLQDAFAEALVINDIAGLETMNAKLAHIVYHPHEPSDIPLDLRGSDFHKRVWSLLRTIPAGTTITYGDLAAELGMRDAREVGEALAANRIAILVPCHRVIKKDGSTSGYRWGVRRKRALLGREQNGMEFKLAS